MRQAEPDLTQASVPLGERSARRVFHAAGELWTPRISSGLYRLVIPAFWLDFRARFR